MYKQIKSNNTRLGLTFWKLLFPSELQTFLDLLLGLLLLIILNAKGLWNYFTNGFLAAQQSEVSDIITQKVQGIHHFLDTISKGRFLQIVFWLFVGCVVYLLIWLSRSMLTNIRNDIVADEFTHPESYSRIGYWGSVLAHKLVLICIFVVLIVYFFAGFRLVSLIAKWAYTALENFQALRTSAEILGAVLATAFLLQILFALIRIFTNSWKFIYKDL
jgi:hypothetical protein